jgi:hypothetical protein
MRKKRNTSRFFVPCVEELEQRFVMDAFANGYFGINARLIPMPSGTLWLTGTSVAIGQVENERPVTSRDNFVHPDVIPTGILYRDRAVTPRITRVTVDVQHAERVAGAMIGSGRWQSDGLHKGVAPDASLTAAATGSPFPFIMQYVDLITTQNLIRVASPKAVNLSFGLGGDPGSPFVAANGRSLFTKGLDWLATNFDVSIVVAAEDDPMEEASPSDIYNGIVVGASGKYRDANGQPVFGKFDNVNRFPVSTDDTNNRTLIQILAPGSENWLPTLDAQGRPIYDQAGGTSYAAPEVTGAIALLQQYANLQGFDDLSKSHLVMKAVLLNSADKIADTGDGLALGMEKTILRRDNTTWLQSPAFTTPANVAPANPLDDQLGAGQLNVRRAINQYSSGDQSVIGNAQNMPAVPVGWTTAFPDPNLRRQVVNLGRLPENSFVSATLTWDRPVDLNDRDQNGVYSGGETFTASDVPRYELILRRKSDGETIRISSTAQYNLDHIFVRVPTTGDYELVINRAFNFTGDGPRYALAWWTDQIPASWPGTISGVAWEDQNWDGERQTGEDDAETLLGGVRAYLYRDSGGYVGTTVTNANGAYSFNNLAPGNYRVVFVPRDGMKFTWMNQVGVSAAFDSDANYNGATDVITVGARAAAIQNSVDVGMLRGAVAAGRAMLDNEPAPGVEATLLASNGDEIDQTLTDDEGNYQFTNLDAGDYMVKFGTLPGERLVSPSGGTSPVFHLDDGQEVDDENAELEDITDNHAPLGANNTITINENEGYTLEPDDFGFSDPNDTTPNNLMSVIITALPTEGTLELDGEAVSVGDEIPYDAIDNGELVYTPPANQYGTALDSFQFENRDDGGTFDGGQDTEASPSTITFDVLHANQPPLGTDNTINLGTDVSRAFVRADFGFSDPNDSTPDAFKAVIVTSLPQVGTLELDGVPVQEGDAITVAQLDANSFVYLAPPNTTSTSQATWQFQVQDTGGTDNDGWDTSVDPNTMTMEFDNSAWVNHASIGTANTVTTLENSPFDFLPSDFGFTDPNDTPANNFAAVIITDLPADGHLQLGANEVTQNQSISINDLPTLAYYPPTNQSGAAFASFGFAVKDDGGVANNGADTDPSPKTMTVNVTWVNQAPTGADNTVTTLENQTRSFSAADFGFSDPVDGNQLQAVIITSLPTAGHLQLGEDEVVQYQSIAASDLTSLTYYPPTNQSGAGLDSFTFAVQDNGGTANDGIDTDPSPKTMTINVTWVNQAPTGADSTVSTYVNTPYIFKLTDFHFSDVDGNSFMAVKITTLPSVGTLLLNDTPVTLGQFISAADISSGNLKFDPLTDELGSPYDQLTFRVQDNGGTDNGGIDLDPLARTMIIDVTQGQLT